MYFHVRKKLHIPFKNVGKWIHSLLLYGYQHFSKYLKVLKWQIKLTFQSCIIFLCGKQKSLWIINCKPKKLSQFNVYLSSTICEPTVALHYGIQYSTQCAPLYTEALGKYSCLHAYRKFACMWTVHILHCLDSMAVGYCKDSLYWKDACNEAGVKNVVNTTSL